MFSKQIFDHLISISSKKTVIGFVPKIVEEFVN